MVEIANIVGSGSLFVELDVEEVANDVDAPIIRYDPDNYHGIYLQYGEEKPLITLYRTGKYIISGAASREELDEAKEQFLQSMVTLGVLNEAVDKSFEVRNFVTTAELGTNVDLNTLSILLGFEHVEYEPEQFPGLIYRPEDHNCVILVFANGKMVITGARRIGVAEQAFEHISNKITELE